MDTGGQLDRADGGSSALDSLDCLLSASLDRLTDRPRAIDLAGSPTVAGYGHLPFAAWLVAAVRPALTVGITRGWSFQAAVCDALLRERVPGEVLSVGFAGEATDASALRAFAGFARPVELERVVSPLPVEDGSVALMHADADLWREGGAGWRRALTIDGVLVLHGLGSGDASAGTPGRAFAFIHDGGMRVEAIGDGPAALQSLWRIAAAGGSALALARERFAWLGERWRQEALAEARRAALASIRTDASMWPGRERMIEALRERSRLEVEVRRLPMLESERAEAHRRSGDLERRLAESERERQALESRLTNASDRRGWLGRRRSVRAGAPTSPAAGATGATGAAGSGRTRRIETVLFVAGEPDTAGAELRARRQSYACAATGRRARWIRIEDVGPDALQGIDLLVLWRAPWSQHVETMVALARGAGAIVAFDIDDLVVEPAFARPEIVDGMRTMGVDQVDLARLFGQFRSTLRAADLALATTEELADHLRFANPVAHVLPNGFDAAGHDAARMARRARAMALPDGEIVRIGYAAGTRTHQRDFALAASGIAAVLQARPQVRLVLFQDGDRATVVTGELPELAGLEDRIEWRDTVPVERLATEIARFDIAICPLEVGNPFCEAKSELKFVEAALAGIPCVASPTGPIARAIEHDRTGLLASEAQEWRDGLIRLVDEPGTRERLGFAAYCDVLWRFGPQRSTALWDGLLRSLEGAREAALQHELRIRRGAWTGYGTPVLAPTDTIFEHDTLRVAEVAVAITCFEYARFVGEALESVAAQTLEAIELVVVDDCSTDGSAALVVAWARANRDRFTRLRVERTRRNSGLGPARNAAFAASEARYVMSLDADNRLLPACCETLHTCMAREDAAFAYSALQLMGGPSPPINAAPYDPARLVAGNYIDAMALVARWAWAAAGGYYDNPDARGWEDYGLWCRLAELGQYGVWHPQTLAEYRVHDGSMTNAVTETQANKQALVHFVERRHRWVRLGSRGADPR